MKGFILKNQTTGEVFNTLANSRVEARGEAVRMKGWKVEEVVLAGEREIPEGMVLGQGAMTRGDKNLSKKGPFCRRGFLA